MNLLPSGLDIYIFGSVTNGAATSSCIIIVSKCDAVFVKLIVFTTPTSDLSNVMKLDNVDTNKVKGVIINVYILQVHLLSMLQLVRYIASACRIANELL